MVKAAIFDMDGLMFDTERLVYENWQKLMDERGYEYSLDIYKHTVGRRKAEVEFFYSEQYGEDFPYWELADIAKARYVERVKKEGLPVKKGLYELLDYLSGEGFKIALATSTSRETSVLNLTVTDTLRYFDEMVCGGEVKNGKPHPEVFLTASEKLGENPRDCLAFEDSANGIRSAHAAGNITVMVPDMIQPDSELLKMVDCLCSDLSESIAFIRSLRGE